MQKCTKNNRNALKCTRTGTYSLYKCTCVICRTTVELRSNNIMKVERTLTSTFPYVNANFRADSSIPILYMNCIN